MARRIAALALAAACAGVALVVYLAVMDVGAVQRLDLRVLEHVMASATPRSDRLARQAISFFNPGPYVVLVAFLLALGLAAGRVRPTVLALAAIVGANLTSHVLKPALATPRPFPVGHYMSPIAWPSGHTTAVVSLALAAVIISPPRLRPFTAIAGAALALAIGYSLVLTGAHYPSDVVGGFLVASAWCSVAAAGLRVSGSALAPTVARSALPPRSRPARG
jgi:membrane-associated phospholipid phosphatase